MKALIDAGASMETADRSGMTVLDIAAASDANLLCHMLLECNLKPSNALTHAIRLGDASIAKVSSTGCSRSVPSARIGYRLGISGFTVVMEINNVSVL